MKLDKFETNRRVHTIRLNRELNPPHEEDYGNKKSGIFTWIYREFRTWKHNRKTQYKMPQ